MKKHREVQGSVLGGMLLVAGSCIGAGMLALPITTGLIGFFPSLIVFFVSWLFMTFTALLLIEVNGWFNRRVNIVSMAKEAFGRAGEIISWFTYIFLFYALLVAYTAVSGEISASFLSDLFSIHVPNWSASVFFVLLFGLFIYFGTKPVDFFNRILMVGLIVAYCGMVLIGLEMVKPSLLLHSGFRYFLIPLPILVVSFGFHNMIPSLTAYFKGDLPRMRITIIGGSLIVLLIYLLWTIVILGVIPFGGESGLLESYLQGHDSSFALRRAFGDSALVRFTHFFAFFAVITSFLAQGLSLTHFIADGIKVSLSRTHNIWLCAISLAPPFFLGLLYPQIFFKALNFAGGICAVILFGILPAGMAWMGRYVRKERTAYHVSGGKISLILAAIFSLFLIFCELSHIFGWKELFGSAQ